MTISPVGATTFTPKLLQSALVRRQLSQYSQDSIGINILTPSKTRGQPARATDPDEGTLELELRFLPASELPGMASLEDPRGDVLVEFGHDQLTREELGVWSATLDPEHTEILGQLTASWKWKIEGREHKFVEHLQILEPMPLYSSLSDAERFAVTQVTWRFGDLFDSTEGGPHLTENFQTHFTSERIAELMLAAINKFNFMAQPATNYTLSCLGTALPSGAMGVLVEGTYIEVLRHFCRSYVEIPEFVNMSVTYTQRRDYLQRWQSILRSEEQDYKEMVITLKRSMMNLGSGALLVSGGIFGGSGKGLFRPGMHVAQTRAWRMYPAAFAVNFPSMKGT